MYYAVKRYDVYNVLYQDIYIRPNKNHTTSTLLLVKGSRVDWCDVYFLLQWGIFDDDVMTLPHKRRLVYRYVDTP